MTSDSDAPILYDHLMVSKSEGQRVSEQGVRAWVNYFQAMGLLKIVKETLSEDWTELYFEPWYASHSMFYAGEVVDGPPIFREVCLRFGSKPWSPTYENIDRVFFSVEFRGCTHERVLEEVTSRTHDILHNTPRVLSKVHVSLPEHPKQEGVALDKRLKLRERGDARTGTRTEDL